MPNTDPSTALLAKVAAAASTARILEEQLKTIYKLADPGESTWMGVCRIEGNATHIRLILEGMENHVASLTAALTPAVPVPDPRQPSTIEATLAALNKGAEKSHTLDAIFAQEENR